MILELAILDIKPEKNDAFERSFLQAQKIIMSMNGYISHDLQKCIEKENRYILLVKWQTLENHTIGFRQSAEYQEWKKLLHLFYDPFPTVEHYHKMTVEKAINKQNPHILTRNCILRLPEIGESKLMRDFVAKNKSHLFPWEPLQTADYYTENYWHNKTIQIREDFLGDKSCCFNIYHKDKIIGMANYSNFVRGAFHSCFLGFKISESEQGQGLMTEALQASIAYIFNQLNIHRISANYMPRNLASSRVLEKCGFQKEGVAEDYLYINGNWEQHILTSLINSDWTEGNCNAK
jgi:ribosomal-protein-alanine N-acetyltransferase